MLFFYRLLTVPLVMAFFPVYSLDVTHDPFRMSWVESANDPSTEFPIQNLPYGVFKLSGDNGRGRIGVAIGSYVFDLKGAVDAGLISGLSEASRQALSASILNDWMALGREEWKCARLLISELLSSENGMLRDNQVLKNQLLIPIKDVELLMPAVIGDYTDFYASIHHASHIGTMLRPENPLMPNYKHMPIGYHGRASSVVISGTAISWPKGQHLGPDGQPTMGYSNKMDYEWEMGALIGPASSLGSPIDIKEAEQHLFGFVLVNDWSARDIQKWEYQPLGPFNGKNFATTISPWVVTLEALEPFRSSHNPRGADDPPLLSYLQEGRPGSFDVVTETYLASESMRSQGIKPLLISQANLANLYWSFDQMVCQHTVSGCNMRPGDLIASGTVSGSGKEALGCLFERTALKMEPLRLPDGTSRQFLADGDEVILKAYGLKEGYPLIGFGECRGIIKRQE